MHISRSFAKNCLKFTRDFASRIAAWNTCRLSAERRYSTEKCRMILFFARAIRYNVSLLFLYSKREITRVLTHFKQVSNLSGKNVNFLFSLLIASEKFRVASEPKWCIWQPCQNIFLMSFHAEETPRVFIRISSFNCYRIRKQNADLLKYIKIDGQWRGRNIKEIHGAFAKTVGRD